MSWCWLNGSIVRTAAATVSVLDRGLLFADGVYEVVGVLEGKLVDAGKHLGRFRRSLAALDLDPGLDDAHAVDLCRRLIERNGIEEGYVYIQVTRGAASSRTFARPPDASPTVFAFAVESPSSTEDWYETGVAVATHEDLRWKRRYIKSVALLPQTIAADAAHRAGAFEALLVEDGWVTEGSSSSFHIVADGGIVMRPLDGRILPGITRATAHEVADRLEIPVAVRPFTLAEARNADEAFLTAANLYVCPVISIDGEPVGSGSVGPVVRRVHEAYMAHIRATLT